MDSQLPLKKKSVAVLGGGLAGLAAAVDLVAKGFQVTLFEKRPLLGGRVYSVNDTTTGSAIDNGQHLLMGCYQATFQFLKTIRSFDKIQFQKSLTVPFLDLEGRRFPLTCPNWPAPFHLAWGLLRWRALSFKEKWRLSRVLRAVQKLKKNEDWQRLETQDAQGWLCSLGQTSNLFRCFWDPIILATLNEIPSRVSAQLLAIVLKKAFLGSKRDSQLVFPQVDLSELFTVPAQQYLENLGATLHLKFGIRQVQVKNHQVETLILEDGTEFQADYYLSALPPDALFSILPDFLQTQTFWSRLSQMTYSSIWGLHLWFEKPLFEESMVGLFDATVQWIFNQKVLSQGKSTHYSVVLSAAKSLALPSHEVLLERVLSDIRQVFPTMAQNKLLHFRILKELKATPSLGPGSQALRLSTKTEFANFFLAGDWTDTGLPATIEGAIQSGQQAASCILKV